MRVFIFFDFEGLFYVVSFEYLSVKKVFYGEVRKIVIEVVKIIVMIFYEFGFEEVVVVDSYGFMVNIIFEEMFGFVKFVRGFLRLMSMVVGSKGSDVVFFLGYYVRSGVGRVIFDYIYSGFIIDWIIVNGRFVSEIFLNVYLFGEWGVFVILVVGDRVLFESDVRDVFLKIVGVFFKESFLRYFVISFLMEVINKFFIKGIKEVVKCWKEGVIKFLSVEKFVKVGVCFLNSGFVDVVEFCFLVRRIDGKIVEFEINSVEEVYKMIEFLIFVVIGVRVVFG